MDASAHSISLAAMGFPVYVAVVMIAVAAVLLRRHIQEHYERILTAAWFAALATAAGAGTVYLQQKGADMTTAIEVDMLASRGNFVEVYLNGNGREPKRLPLVLNERHIYRFEDLPTSITLVRLDPTNANDARIVLYGFRFKAGNRVLREFGPEDLRSWSMNDLSIPGRESGGLTMASTTDDPRLATGLSLTLPGSGGWSRPIMEVVNDPSACFLIAMAFFLTLMVCGMTERDGLFGAALVAVVICAAYPVVAGAMRLGGHPPPVNVSVGLAAYTGYPKSREFLGPWLLLLVCLALPYVFHRFGRAKTGAELAEKPLSQGAPKVWIVHAAVLLFLLLYLQPNLWGGLVALGQATYSHYEWDGLNSLSWSYMVNAGLRPFKDFWYPYAGIYARLLPFPVGAMAQLAEDVLVLWFLYLGLFYATGRRIAHTLSLYALVLVAAFLNWIPNWFRYLLALDVALLHIAISDAKRFDWKRHLLFTGCVAFAFFCEPSQVAYAAIGILVYTALTLRPLCLQAASTRVLTDILPVLKQRLLYTGAPILAGVAASMLVYGINGMLPGLWDFETSLGDLADYGAFPADVASWVAPVLRPDAVFLMLFLLIAYGTYRWLRRGDKLGSVLLMICMIGFVVMQKQILRPHAMTQVRIYPYIGLLIYGLIMWRERPRAARPAIAIFAGCVFGLAASQHFFQSVYRQAIVDAGRIASGNLDTLIHRGAEIRAANADRYARHRFRGFDEQNAVIDTLLGEYGLQPQDRIYVLGDDSSFYILLNRPEPYLSNAYNASPIYEQEHVVEWLRRERPRFVVWPPADRSYDLVPHMVRVPLIYSYIVEHYEFLRSVGRHQILTALAAGRRPDVSYWRGALGDTIDLGHVPRLARLSSYAGCRAGSPCEDILVVSYPRAAGVLKGWHAGLLPAGTSNRGAAGPLNQKTSLLIATTAGDFRLQFDLAPGAGEYVVHLERLWFWNVVQTPARIQPENAGPQARIERRREPRPVLY